MNLCSAVPRSAGERPSFSKKEGRDTPIIEKESSRSPNEEAARFATLRDRAA